MAFKPPTEAKRLRAIGATTELPDPLRRALEPGSAFQPLPAPQLGDWLAEHREPGQTFAQFARQGWHRPDDTRSRIYLQPLGAFPEGQSPALATLAAYAEACFCLGVEALSPLAVGDRGFTTRRNPYTGNRQVLTGDVLDFLRARLPGDAFCAVAVSMQDLYPDASWNFCFGQASLRDRVGVYSFVRYDPAFYGQARGEGYQATVLRRSCKVFAHETAHLFGLQHCIFFQCMMNGSNHLEESDARPMHLCPVCLRKLQHSVGFDVVARYRRLERFYRAHSLDDEAGWMADRLEEIGM
jgi:archaemetzincin